MPVLRKSVPELQEYYSRAKQTAQEQAPRVTQAAAATVALKPKIADALDASREAATELREVSRNLRAAEALKASLQSKVLAKVGAAASRKGEVGNDARELSADAAAASKAVVELSAHLAQVEKAVTRAAGSLADLRGAYAVAEAAAGGVVVAFADAVDPQLVMDCVKGVGVGVLSCVAVATAPLAGAVTLGADLGVQLGNRAAGPLVRGALASLGSGGGSGLVGVGAHPAVVEWACAGLTSACAAAGVACALRARGLALTVSACAFGAQLVAGCVCDQLYDWTGRDLADVTWRTAGLEASAPPGFLASAVAAHVTSHVSDETSAARLLSGVLLAGGLLSQLGPAARNAPLPAPLKVALAPLITLEASLKAKAAASALVRK